MQGEIRLEELVKTFGDVNAVGTTMIAITLALALGLLPLTLWRRNTEPPAPTVPAPE